jgi:hypothetical protein
MPHPAVHARPAAQSAGATLASRSYPPRVRKLLEGVLGLVAAQLEYRLQIVLEDTEDMLFRHSDEADSRETRADCYTAISELKRGRAELFPRFLAGLESALAKIGDPPPAGARGGIIPLVEELALVDDEQHHEDSVIEGIANRANVRHGLALSLLGQRFAVLAARPPIDADRLPVGPKSLCRILGEALRHLDLSAQHRVAVYRQFDRVVFPRYAELLDAINAYLIREDVLASLQHVPLRSRGAAPRGAGGPPRQRRAMQGPDTHWPGELRHGQAEDDAAADELEQAFARLQRLLARRGAAGSADHAIGRQGDFVIPRTDLDAVLGQLQRQADGVAPMSGSLLKTKLLDLLQVYVPVGASPVLDDEDADTIDLICLLFEQIMLAVRADSPAATLLAMLHLPILRLALYDKRVFLQPHHPARQLVNLVAESGATWRVEQDTDHALIEKLRAMVMRVVNEFDGDGRLFVQLLEELEATLKTMVERARASERRYVEAARGRERLALARLHANRTIAGTLAGHTVPDYIRTLLTQAWADVLALTALRQGSESDAFRRQVAIARWLVDAATDGVPTHVPLDAAETRHLREEIRQALEQVGYHGEDAEAIAASLTQPGKAGEAGVPAELEARLQARARLGEQVQPQPDDDVTTLQGEAAACYERICQLPFGTWMEFASPVPGTAPRRSRLSWYSVVTGQALFVNTRGLRVGEHSLAWMAREMAAGHLRVVQAERGPPIDQAWSAVLAKLDAFAEGTAPAGDRSA